MRKINSVFDFVQQNYVDDENGVFYVTKIGHLPATGNSSDAK